MADPLHFLWMTEPQLAQNDWPDMAPWKITNWKLSAAALANFFTCSTAPIGLSAARRINNHHHFSLFVSTFERVTFSRVVDSAVDTKWTNMLLAIAVAVYLSTCEANACHFSRLFGVARLLFLNYPALRVPPLTLARVANTAMPPSSSLSQGN